MLRKLIGIVIGHKKTFVLPMIIVSVVGLILLLVTQLNHHYYVKGYNKAKEEVAEQYAKDIQNDSRIRDIYIDDFDPCWLQLYKKKCLHKVLR